MDLYVVSDQITDANFDLAYGEVVRIARQMQDPWFDPFQIKVLGTSAPLAQALLTFQAKHPGAVGWQPGRRARSLSADEAFIYPLSATVPH